VLIRDPQGCGQTARRYLAVDDVEFPH